MEKVKFHPLKTHQTYKTDSGERVDGCSTIAKIGEDSGALIHWAWKCGCEGLDYRKVRDTAASTGTLAHWMAECHIRGQEPDLSEFSPAMVAQAETCFIKFLDWWKGKTLIASELQLVSNQHGYGGTMDILCREDASGRVILADLKTSKAIYPSMWRQLAGLNGLVLENLSGDQHPGQFDVVRIGKEDEADFEVQTRMALGKEFEAFLAALDLCRKLK